MGMPITTDLRSLPNHRDGPRGRVGQLRVLWLPP
jgi:hypothetical protein